MNTNNTRIIAIVLLLLSGNGVFCAEDGGERWNTIGKVAVSLLGFGVLTRPFVNIASRNIEEKAKIKKDGLLFKDVLITDAYNSQPRVIECKRRMRELEKICDSQRDIFKAMEKANKGRLDRRQLWVCAGHYAVNPLGKLEEEEWEKILSSDDILSQLASYEEAQVLLDREKRGLGFEVSGIGESIKKYTDAMHCNSFFNSVESEIGLPFDLWQRLDVEQQKRVSKLREDRDYGTLAVLFWEVESDRRYQEELGKSPLNQQEQAAVLRSKVRCSSVEDILSAREKASRMLGCMPLFDPKFPNGYSLNPIDYIAGFGEEDIAGFSEKVFNNKESRKIRRNMEQIGKLEDGVFGADDKRALLASPKHLAIDPMEMLGVRSKVIEKVNFAPPFDSRHPLGYSLALNAEDYLKEGEVQAKKQEKLEERPYRVTELGLGLFCLGANVVVKSVDLLKSPFKRKHSEKGPSAEDRECTKRKVVEHINGKDENGCALYEEDVREMLLAEDPEDLARNALCMNPKTFKGEKFKRKKSLAVSALRASLDEGGVEYYPIFEKRIKIRPDLSYSIKAARGHEYSYICPAQQECQQIAEKIVADLKEY